MDVQLLEEESPIEEIRIFGYNRIDFFMMVFCGVIATLMFVFFIWFLIEHVK